MESYDELLQPLALKPESLERVLGMKSEIHQRGFLSVRHLLRSFGYTDQDLFYDEFGKPHLKDGKHISISHSFTFSGIAISDSEIGIDIEKQRDKISIIAHKFVDYEFDYLDKEASNYIRKLTVIWCIKESLYKLFATPGMLFRDHFLVIPLCWKMEKPFHGLILTTINIDSQGIFLNLKTLPVLIQFLLNDVDLS